MMRRVCLAALLLLAWMLPGWQVRAGERPPLLWELSDDVLSSPVGTIADVAVGADGVVYLLDTQNSTVFRIAVDGRELPSLGRAGEGPGEFLHPILVTERVGGGCVVIQDYHAPSVCLDPRGRECAGPDLSAIRERFTVTQFFGARADELGRFYLTSMTSDGVPDSPTGSANGGAWSVFRVGPGNRVPTVLFSDRAELCAPKTVRMLRYAASFTDRCWDVNAVGRILFADPAGGYRVTLGHPVDGESHTIDLPFTREDEVGLQALARATGQDVDDIPRIASVYWMDDQRFIVKPMACVKGRSSSRAGVFELFDSAGKSNGRNDLRCDYDPERDEFFLRNGTLVIVDEGKVAMAASIRRKAAAIGERTEAAVPNAIAADVIRIRAYDLVAYYGR